jgi:hypothetical protein
MKGPGTGGRHHTEIRGYADRGQPYELERFEILGSDGVDGLAADLG